LICLIPWSPHMALFVLHFILCFVKVSRWWGVTRFAQPHILVYMFCPYVISTPLPVTCKVTNETFKRHLSCGLLLPTTFHLREMN
jgi:hypothetical protein